MFILVNAFNCRFQLWIADAFYVYCADGNLRLWVYITITLLRNFRLLPAAF